MIINPGMQRTLLLKNQNLTEISTTFNSKKPGRNLMGLFMVSKVGHSRAKARLRISTSIDTRNKNDAEGEMKHQLGYNI